MILRKVEAALLKEDLKTGNQPSSIEDDPALMFGRLGLAFTEENGLNAAARHALLDEFYGRQARPDLPGERSRWSDNSTGHAPRGG